MSLDWGTKGRKRDHGAAQSIVDAEGHPQAIPINRQAGAGARSLAEREHRIRAVDGSRGRLLIDEANAWNAHRQVDRTPAKISPGWGTAPVSKRDRIAESV